jgi:hypothetical protein
MVGAASPVELHDGALEGGNAMQPGHGKFAVPVLPSNPDPAPEAAAPDDAPEPEAAPDDVPPPKSGPPSPPCAPEPDVPPCCPEADPEVLEPQLAATAPAASASASVTGDVNGFKKDDRIVFASGLSSNRRGRRSCRNVRKIQNESRGVSGFGTERSRGSSARVRSRRTRRHVRPGRAAACSCTRIQASSRSRSRTAASRCRPDVRRN